MLMCRFVRFLNEHFRVVDLALLTVQEKDVKCRNVIKDMVSVLCVTIEYGCTCEVF